MNETLAKLLRKLYGIAETGASTYAGTQQPYTAEQAKGMLSTMADFTPGVGDVKSAYEGMQAAREGDYLGAALGGLGALPMVPNIAGMFIGKGAKTWDAVNHLRAVEMEKAGIDPRAIWKETGNWKGPDGKWRQEIPDNISSSKIDYLDSGRIRRDGGGEPYIVDEYLHHPKLLRSYENIGDIPMYPNRSKGVDASFNPSDGSISVKFGEQPKLTPSRVPRTGSPSLEEIGYRGSPPSNILHEIQHFIQQEEGWAKGGSPKEHTMDIYKKLAGEAEARATQARIKMNAEQRRKAFPADSYDMPIKDLLFR